MDFSRQGLTICDYILVPVNNKRPICNRSTSFQSRFDTPDILQSCQWLIFSSWSLVLSFNWRWSHTLKKPHNKVKTERHKRRASVVTAMKIRRVSVFLLLECFCGLLEEKKYWKREYSKVREEEDKKEHFPQMVRVCLHYTEILVKAA